MSVKKTIRQRASLARLEAAYEKFKAAGEDKKPYSSTRNGRVVNHKGRSYAEECKRLSDEIKHLKAILGRVVE